jgi:hypothetical protein
MSFLVVTHWFCRSCEVEGRDPEPDPRCWNCGRSVTVTARPTVPAEQPRVGTSDPRTCRGGSRSVRAVRPDGHDVTAHCPLSCIVGPADDGFTSKSKIAVGR